MAEKISSDEDPIFMVSELKNLTSDLSLLKVTDRAEVLQCDSSTITFQAPTVAASVGQLISLNGLLKIKGIPNTQVSVVGKISELVAAGPFSRITIKMTQFDKVLWKRYLENLSTKQTHVDKLFNSMKGED